jgi:hypothetical protein
MMHESTWFTTDRILAGIAILIGVGGIWRAERLFSRLEKQLQELLKNLHMDILKQVNNSALAYSAFRRAAQGLDFAEDQLTPDAAFTLLLSNRLHQDIYPHLTSEQHAQLRQETRANIEIQADKMSELLIANGMAKMKAGWEYNPDFGKPKDEV